MSTTYSAFSDTRLVARGTEADIAAYLRANGETGVLVFDDESGRQTEIAYRAVPPTPEEPKRGRPKLGVVAREVTLLPRHWDWLSTQRGGASATLRRLVEAASALDDAPMKRDAAYRFLQAIAGDFPGYEEALRHLYAGSTDDFRAAMADWPADIRAHALRLSGLG